MTLTYSFSQNSLIIKFLGAICDYDFKNTEIQGYVKPFKVFEKSELKIGVFGLGVELKGLMDAKNYGEAQYLDPVAKTN